MPRRMPRVRAGPRATGRHRTAPAVPEVGQALREAPDIRRGRDLWERRDFRGCRYFRRVGRRWPVIRYTRQVVFVTAIGLARGALAQVPAAAGRHAGRPGGRGHPGGPGRCAASSGGGAACSGSCPADRSGPVRRDRAARQDLGAQTRAAGGGSRQEGQGGAQGHRRRQGLFAAASRQLVRAEDPRPGSGGRPLLRRQQRLRGERHVPGPQVPALRSTGRCSA